MARGIIPNRASTRVIQLSILLVAAATAGACGDDSPAGPTPAPSAPDAGTDGTTSSASRDPGATSLGTTPSNTDPSGPDPDSSSVGPGPSPTTPSDTLTSDDEHSQPPSPAVIEARLARPEAAPFLQSFRRGAASAETLASLKYYVRSIQVCESLEVQGSGFNNPQGCLELYRGDESVLSSDLEGDLAPTAEAARSVEEGYIDLMSASSRSLLTRSTTLEAEHVRSYNFGIITWALPVKVTAAVDLGDGSHLFTHDGVTTSELIGADSFRNYFTRSAVSLLDAPAEEAVVLLGNGGNWFKFQRPFEITQADIDEGRNWVLDLVFNPDGIVKGYEGNYVNGNLREEDEQGTPIRGITVPMIDLAPVPHRELDHVVRESYLAPVTLGGNSFDVRLEVYSLEGDPNRTVLGVDVKTLLTASTNEPPTEAAKVAFVSAQGDGQLRFGSFKDSTLIGDFVRLENVGDRHVASVTCATHEDRSGAEGGALLVASSCPSASFDVEFTLQSRARLDGSLTFGGNDPDAGVPHTEPSSEADAGLSVAPTDASAAASSDEVATGSEDSAATLSPDAGLGELSLEINDASVDAAP